MEQFDVFTVRDLRERTGDLMRDAEAGHLALITEHGRPKFLAGPFDERLLGYGVNRAMAIHLFEKSLVTLSQAAKISALSVEDFLDLLNEVGIPAVDYPLEEFDDEVQSFSNWGPLLIDAGEADAIFLALEQNARMLIIDDKRGRRTAKNLNLPLLGTGGVLIAAKRAGHLNEVTSVLNDLTKAGYPISPSLSKRIIELTGD